MSTHDSHLGGQPEGERPPWSPGDPSAMPLTNRPWKLGIASILGGLDDLTPEQDAAANEISDELLVADHVPTTRARLMRRTVAFAGDVMGKEPRPFQDFLYSAEELRGGLAAVLGEMPRGYVTDQLARNYSITGLFADYDSEPETPTLFEDDELPIAAALLFFGLEECQSNREQGSSLIKPADLWSDYSMSLVVRSLSAVGFIEGSQEQRLEMVKTTRSKFYARLEKAVLANEAAERELSESIPSEL